MNLIQRAQNIVLNPKAEWSIIAEEKSDTVELFKNYIIPLSAIPAVAGFIGMSVIGFSVPFLGTVRMSMLAGITSLIMHFVFGLVGIYLFSLIIDALAPKFDAEKNPGQALKLAAYSFTPVWVAGVLLILPSLGMLVLLAALYSIYLFFIGLPVLMKSPQDKTPAYAAVTIACCLVIGLVFGAIVNSINGSFSPGLGSLQSTSKNPEVNGALGELEKMSKKMEEAGKKMEEAKKSGDPQAEMKAATDALGTVLNGGSQVEVVDKDKLKALLPETIANLKRSSIEGEKSAMGEFKVSKAEARYNDENNHQLRITITDTGGSKMFGAMFAWGMMEQDKETDGGYEKMGKVNGRPTHESFQKDGSSGEYGLLVGGRFLVETRGQNVDMATIKSASAAVGYDKLESMKNEGVKQ